MNTTAAAALLSDILGTTVTPKALRRHLRNHPRWTAVGMGATYSLDKNDVRGIAKEMKDDAEKAQTRVKRTKTNDPFPELCGGPLATPADLRKAQRDRAFAASLASGRAAREARLLARMKEAGVGVR